MVKWIVCIGLLLIGLGGLFFVISQATLSPSSSIKVKEWIYEEMFELSPQEYRIYNFTFPSNKTFVIFFHSTSGGSCIGLEIVDEENYRRKVLGEIYSYVSRSYTHYHEVVIPVKEKEVYHIICYNDPGCYVKSVELKIGYVEESVKPITSGTIKRRTIFLSLSLASSALGLIVSLYGFAKESKEV